MMRYAVLNVNSAFLLLLIVCCTRFSTLAAQDGMPQRGTSRAGMSRTHSLPERRTEPEVIATSPALPALFKGGAPNRIVDSFGSLNPVLEQLRLLKSGHSTDTLRVVHIGDSHVRGHIYPQTAGKRLVETFGAVSYTDMGVNGATCLTFTQEQRIAEIVACNPDLLILSFGTNESHNRHYKTNTHYQQMDELIGLLQASLPNRAILLTTPPGSYESFRRRKRRTYAINPRTPLAARTIADFAANERLALWDLYGAVGGQPYACKNWAAAGLLRPDHVHYLPEGYVLQGQLLYEAIIKAYNEYVSNKF